MAQVKDETEFTTGIKENEDHDFYDFILPFVEQSLKKQYDSFEVGVYTDMDKIAFKMPTEQSVSVV